MVGSAKQHLDELLKLSSDERSEAAERLLNSLDEEPEAEDENTIAAAWANEIERRVDDNAPGVDADAVFAQAKARLEKRS